MPVENQKKNSTFKPLRKKKKCYYYTSQNLNSLHLSSPKPSYQKISQTHLCNLAGWRVYTLQELTAGSPTAITHSFRKENDLIEEMMNMRTKRQPRNGL